MVSYETCSLNRRVPAAVECYESASGSLSKVGTVLERARTTKNERKTNNENDNKSDDGGRVCSRIIGNP